MAFIVIQYTSQRKQARFCSSLGANFLLCYCFHSGHGWNQHHETRFCQTRILQPIKTLTLAIRLLLLQAIVTVTGPKHSKNGETLCSIEGLFPPNIYSCFTRKKTSPLQTLSVKKVRVEEVGKAGESGVFFIIFTSTTKYSCCREVTAVPMIPFTWPISESFAV